MPVKVVEGGQRREPERAAGVARERDIAEFRERRNQVVRRARAEAAERIARDGTVATVSDALEAIRDPQAACWGAEREQLDQPLAAAPRETATAAIARCARSVGTLRAPPGTLGTTLSSRSPCASRSDRGATRAHRCADPPA